MAAVDIEHMERLGAELRRLRREAGFTMDALAWASFLSTKGYSHIEYAERRTRPATLARIAHALAARLETDADDLTEHLCALAGPSLSPDTDYAAKKQRGRERKRAEAERLMEAAMPLAEEIAKKLARSMYAAERARRRNNRRKR